MSMETNSSSIRRPIRPRQQPQPQQPITALKKPRLTTPAVPTISRSTGGGGGGAYEPQMQPHAELVSQYKAALAELTFNSKPIITNLTIIAGESLHAAKAIAFTICNHILEVSSEQKLPSLYLLDSIVKNIGADFIKYFATRLPEVFCKAYRQVDPPIHASMRHLFGTWKGVFPLQCLQMIEKELGFSSASNGSASGSATSKTNSQLQRPPNSIHVNPKYLEKQGLPQPTRAKGMANDITAPLASSTEDLERPDRSSIIGAKRSWADPRIKMLNSQRETLSGSAAEPKLGALYGELGYGSDVPRDPGLGVGRVGGRVLEQGHDKPSLGVGLRVAQATSGQRNGLNMKHGYSTPKSAAVDLRQQPRQTIASRNSSCLSANWKNSEEEEFLWERHSRMSDQDPGNISGKSKKDNWSLAESEKMEGGSRFDMETSSNSPSYEQMDQTPASWQLQESHSSDLVQTGTSDVLEGHTSFGRLTTNAGLVRTAVQSPFEQSLAGTIGQKGSLPLVAASLSNQLPRHQQASSVTFAARNLHQQSNYSAEQDYAQSSYKEPQSSRKLLVPLNTQLGYSAGLQIEEFNNSSPRPFLQQSHRHLLSKQQPDSKQSDPSVKAQKASRSLLTNFETPSSSSSASDHSDPLAAEASGQSNTNNLLATIVDGGILSNITSTGPPHEVVQEVGRSSAGSKSLSHDVTSASSDASEKIEQRTPSSVKASKSVKKPASPISNLLTSLVEKGLISASKLNTSTILPLQVPKQEKSPSISTPSSAPGSSHPVSPVAHHSPAMDEASSPEPGAKSSIVLPHPTIAEPDNLIGVELKPDVIRELHPNVIGALSDDLPHHCGLCGLRLKVKERLERHMKWHDLKNSEPKGVNSTTRRWYPNSEDWAAGKAQPWRFEYCDSVEEFGTEMASDEPVVIADEDHCVCPLCGELFEDYYSLERKKWMFKGAVRMSLPSDDAETGSISESAKGPIIHEDCLTESSVHDLGLATSIKGDKNV